MMILWRALNILPRTAGYLGTPTITALSLSDSKISGRTVSLSQSARTIVLSRGT